MRSRPRFWGYFILAIVLLLVISLPRSWIYRARGATAEIFFPLWDALAQGKRALDPRMTALEEKIQHLRIENQLLQEALQQQQGLFAEARRLNFEYGKVPLLPPAQRDSYLQRLNQQLKALPAQVIYRSPATWHSALWINVGSEDNQRVNSPIVAKNSPVIVNGAIVGILDQIGLRQSRVRLITDSGLTPSVRAVRGSFQDMLLLQELSLFIDRLKSASALLQEDVRNQLVRYLNKMNDILQPIRRESSWFLAKGELHGSSYPLWRFRGTQLQGEGFNFDFPDETGTARDLRSGAPIDNPLGEKISLLKARDLLVTTGMDGIFPAGFPVAEVTKVEPLKEGDFCYTLEARPIVDHLNELSLVFVLPPIGYDGANAAAKKTESL